MKFNREFNVDVNLRTRGWGITVIGNDMHLTAVNNRLNRVRFRAHAVLEHYAKKSDEEVRAFIHEFIEDHKLKRAHGFLGLSRNQVSIQIAEFPLDAEENLDEVLEYQIENIFPGDFENFDFFHQLIGKAEQLRVMVVAVKKEVMGRLFAEIRKYRLALSGMTLNAFCVANMLGKKNGGQLDQAKVVVFHFDAEGMEVITIRNGKLLGTQYIALTDDDFKDPMVRGLEECLSRTRIDPNEVDAFLLSGTPQEAHLQFLTQDIGITFQPMQDSYAQEIPPEAFSGFALAKTAVFDKVPLALNMLPGQLRKKHSYLLPIVAAVILVLGGSYVVLQKFKTSSELKRELTFIRKQNADLEEQLQTLTAIQVQHDAKQEEVKAYEKFRYSEGMLLKLLVHLTKTLPDHTFLTSFSIKDGDKLTISGESEEPFAVRSQLQALSVLRAVDTANAITPGRDKRKKKFTFKAEIVLEALK